MAATAVRGGIVTSAEDFADAFNYTPAYHFDDSPYQARVYNGFEHADPSKDLFYGPNIKDWPKRPELRENILLKICSKILDEVTTTDELIPSGETSSYRSNPLGLAEFTLSRRDPAYVGKTKAVDALETARENAIENGEDIKNMLSQAPELERIYQIIHDIPGQENLNPIEIEIGSVIYANKPGDGSAREQAASCQRVIGGLANITRDYATKRYRSNVINWGMLPFHLKGDESELSKFDVDDWIYIPDIKTALRENNLNHIMAYIIKNGGYQPITLYIRDMTENEREIIQAGCLINFNAQRLKAEK